MDKTNHPALKMSEEEGERGMWAAVAFADSINYLIYVENIYFVLYFIYIYLFRYDEDIYVYICEILQSKKNLLTSHLVTGGMIDEDYWIQN